jgi:hypothetical protein
MPKIINPQGKKVTFHPIVVRFTDPIFEQLKIISESSGQSLNEVIRDMVDRELQLVAMIKEPSKNQTN